jgi:hypothetical protein
VAPENEIEVRYPFSVCGAIFRNVTPKLNEGLPHYGIDLVLYE